MPLPPWISAVVLRAGRAVPEVERQAGGVDQVDLVRDRRLHEHVAARQRAEVEAVVGQRAGIVEHAVDAADRSCRRRVSVTLTVPSSVRLPPTSTRSLSGPPDDIGLAEFEIEHASRVERADRR